MSSGISLGNGISGNCNSRLFLHSLLSFLWIGDCGQDCAIRAAMESTRSRSTSLGWKLAFFGPLAVAVVLQVISAKQADLHTGVRLSIIGNVFLSLSLIAQATYLMRKSTAWGIAMLIFASAVLGFGLHVLLRAL